MQLVADLIPEATLAEQTAGLLRAQRLLHGYGVTAWQDAMLGRGPGGADVTPRTWPPDATASSPRG